MLAVAAQLDSVTCLLAVVAAVLPVRSLGLDGALTGRVSAFGRSSHVEPPLARVRARGELFRITASTSRARARNAPRLDSTPLRVGAQAAQGLVDEVPASGNAIDEVPPVQLPFVGYGGSAEPIHVAVLLPDDPDGYGDRGLRERDSKRRL